MDLLPFGESIFRKQPDKGPRHDVHGNMGPRLLDGGIFLGYSRYSNTYMVGTDEGVQEARAIQRRPYGDRWDEAQLCGIKATPWDMRAANSSEAIFVEEVPKEAAPAEPKQMMARRLKITKATLDTYGYTSECPLCDHYLRYGTGKSGLGHTETCRARIVTAMDETPEGRARLEATEERINRSMADFVENRETEARSSTQPQDDGHQMRSHEMIPAREPPREVWPRDPQVWEVPDQAPAEDDRMEDGDQGADHDPTPAEAMDIGTLGATTDKSPPISTIEEDGQSPAADASSRTCFFSATIEK